METFIFGCFQLQKEQKKKWHLIDSSFFCEKFQLMNIHDFLPKKLTRVQTHRAPRKKLANFIEKKIIINKKKTQKFNRKQMECKSGGTFLGGNFLKMFLFKMKSLKSSAKRDNSR